MARRKNTTNYIYLSFLMAIVIIVAHGHTLIFNLNEFLCAHDAEGIKNYFTTMWYVKYDGYSIFSGMNYPYGSNIFSSDCQPLFSYFLHKLSLRHSGTEDFTVLFINLLMLASIFPCIYYLYKILKYFGVGSGYASVATVLITFLSPQLSNISGNYALSYSVAIPVLWYFTLKVNEKLRYINAFWIVIILLVSAGFHTDYLSLGSLFLTVLALVNVLFFRQKNRIQNSIILLSCVIIAIGLYSFCLYKFGAFDGEGRLYNVTSEGGRIMHLEWLFLPQQSLTAKVLHRIIQYQEFPVHFRSYVGIASILIIFIFSTLYNNLRKKDLDIGTGFAKYVITVILCMAIGVFTPDKRFSQWDAWYHIPSVIQVSWIFYYVFTVMAALALYRIKTYMEYRTQAVSALTLTSVLLSLWAYEANNHLNSVFKPITTGGRIAFSYIRDYNFDKILDNHKRKNTDYQAIISLPFFNKGGGVWEILRSDKSVFSGTKVAYNLGIPLISSYLSSIPHAHAIGAINLLSDKYLDKSLIAGFHSQHPILVVVSDSINAPEEILMLRSSKYLGTTAKVSLYELPVSFFSPLQLSPREYILDEKSSLKETKTFSLPQKDTISISLSFDISTIAKSLPTITFILEDENHLSLTKRISLSNSTNISQKEIFAIANMTLPSGKYTLKAETSDNSIIPKSLTVRSLQSHVHE